jgi:hypothetical protein
MTKKGLRRRGKIYFKAFPMDNHPIFDWPGAGCINGDCHVGYLQIHIFCPCSGNGLIL